MDGKISCFTLTYIFFVLSISHMKKFTNICKKKQMYLSSSYLACSRQYCLLATWHPVLCKSTKNEVAASLGLPVFRGRRMSPKHGRDFHFKAQIRREAEMKWFPFWENVFIDWNEFHWFSGRGNEDAAWGNFYSDLLKQTVNSCL